MEAEEYMTLGVLPGVNWWKQQTEKTLCVL
jgi:hypothetical protein